MPRYQLDPSPSKVELVKGNPQADAIWKRWFNNMEGLVNYLRGPRALEITITLDAAKTAGVNDPTFSKVADDGAGSTGVFMYTFISNQERELFLNVHFGKNYVASSDLDIDLHWGPTTANAGNVVWGLEYIWVNEGEAAPANSTIVEAAVAVSGVAAEHQESNIATIDGTGKLPKSILVGRFFRNGADAADTYPDDAFASTLDMDTIKTIQ